MDLPSGDGCGSETARTAAKSSKVIGRFCCPTAGPARAMHSTVVRITRGPISFQVIGIQVDRVLKFTSIPHLRQAQPGALRGVYLDRPLDGEAYVRIPFLTQQSRI